MRVLVASICIACAWVLPVQAETSVQVRVGTPGFEFGFLYSDYYRVEVPVVERCSQWLSEPDLVVALHLARRSGVALNIIVDWRRGGMTWYDITHRCNLTTTVYYVELPSDCGPPYGRAVGHWRQHRHKDMRLSDDEIRAFVQLQALSEHGHRTPAEVLRLRKAGKSPGQIAASRPGKAEARHEDTSPTGKGKGKGHGKGKKH